MNPGFNVIYLLFHPLGSLKGVKRIKLGSHEVTVFASDPTDSGDSRTIPLFDIGELINYPNIQNKFKTLEHVQISNQIVNNINESLRFWEVGHTSVFSYINKLEEQYKSEPERRNKTQNHGMISTFYFDTTKLLNKIYYASPNHEAFSS